jgi:hypothetical protein
MLQKVYQVTGTAQGSLTTFSWVVATYSDEVEATDHTEFLNGLLSAVRAEDVAQGNEELMVRLGEGNDFDSKFPRGGSSVSYALVPVPVLSRSPVRPAGVASAMDQLRGTT